MFLPHTHATLASLLRLPSVVPTGPPRPILLLHHVQGCGPRARGASHHPGRLEGGELLLRRRQLLRVQPPEGGRDRRAAGAEEVGGGVGGVLNSLAENLSHSCSITLLPTALGHLS